MGSTVKYAVQLDDQMSTDLKSLGGVVSSFDEKIDRLVSSLEGMKRAELEAAMAAREADAALRKEAEAADKAKQEADQLAKEQKEVAEASQRAATQLGTVVTALAAIGAAAFSAVKKMADLRNKFNDLSVATGFTAQELAGIDLAARSNGLALENLVSSLAQFSKRLQDASEGTGEAKLALDALGVSATDSAGNVKDATAANREVIDALLRVENITERAAYATEIYGEAGGKVLKILADGSTTIDTYNSKIEALGLSLHEGGKGAADFQVALADLDTKLDGSIDRIVQAIGGESAFADAIQSFILGLTFVEQYLASIGTNFVALIDLVKSTATLIPRAIKAAFEGEDISDIFVSYVTDFTDALQNPVTNAIAAAKQLAAARAEFEATQGTVTEGAEDEGPAGVKATKETPEQKAAREETDKNTKAVKELTDALGTAAPGQGGSARGALLGAKQIRDTFSADAIKMAGDELGVTLSEIESQIANTTDVSALAELGGLLDRFSEAADDATKGLKENADANRKSAAETAKNAEEIARQRQASVQAGVGAALGGPQAILSAIGSTGPQGAIIAQVAGLLEAIGSAEKGETPLDQVVTFVDAIAAGLEALGPVLADVLPKLLIDSIPALIAAIPEAMIAIVDEAIPALLEAIPELIQVLITDVIPILSTYKVQIVKAVVTSVLPALMDALFELARTLADPSYWMQAIKDVRRQIGAGLGQIFAQIVQGYADIGSTIQNVVQNAFSLEFWKSVLQGLIDAITDFEFNTPGLDAFRRNAGIETGGATGLRGLAERAGDRFDGGMTVNFNGLGFGDDRAILTRIANARNNRRTGARS